MYHLTISLSVPEWGTLQSVTRLYESEEAAREAAERKAGRQAHRDHEQRPLITEEDGVIYLSADRLAGPYRNVWKYEITPVAA